MNRIHHFATLLLVVIASLGQHALGQASDGGAATAARPNVVIFLTDDQAWGDLSRNGNPYALTPRIDQFADQSVEMERFYVSPVCAPTRASLMTGRWNFRTGVCTVNSGHLNPGETTIAQLFQQAGYATRMFGKWHLGSGEGLKPHQRGFDHAWYANGTQVKGTYHHPKNIEYNGAPYTPAAYTIDEWTNLSAAAMKECHAADKPFFIYLATNLVHTPLDPKKEYAERYKSKGLPCPGIYGMQDSIDENFGKLLDAIDELGIADNTIVIYFSDNGPQGKASKGRFMGGLRGVKGTVYENGVRVPFYMRWPAGQITGGRVIKRLGAHVDILPTLLAACGIPMPDGLQIDGRNLLPLLNGAADPGAWPDREIFLQWDAHSYPIKGAAFTAVTENYKLVQARGLVRQTVLDQYQEIADENQHPGNHSIDGPAVFELFDINQDPDETTDIAAQHPEVVERLRASYDAWFESVIGGMGPRKTVEEVLSEIAPRERSPEEEAKRQAKKADKKERKRSKKGPRKQEPFRE